MNECALCHRMFASLASGFDKHQDVDYKRDPVIICLDPATVGLHQDARGVWRGEGGYWSKKETSDAA